MADPTKVQFGNEGKELKPGETENLSSIHHEEGDAKELNDRLKPEEEDGKPDIVKDM